MMSPHLRRPRAGIAARARPALALPALALLCSLPCAAQRAVTVYAGYQDGGSFQTAASPATTLDLAGGGAGALSVDWPLDANRQYQLYAAWQRTEIAASSGGTVQPAVPLSVGYLHLGGSNFFNGPVGQGPYVVGGLGLTVMAPNLAGLSNEVMPSLNLGLGYQLPLAKNLSLRLELRGYLTLVNSSSSLFCSGGCVVSIQGDSFGQGVAQLGLSFGF